jgi:hypothetical protein
MRAPVQRCKDLHVANETSHNAKPRSGFGCLASTDWTLAFHRSVAGHSTLPLLEMNQ